MAYPKNYRQTNLIEDHNLAVIIDKLVNLDLGEKLQVTFPNKRSLFKMRYKLYALLNSLGRKEDFKLLRKEKVDGKWMLEVVPQDNILAEVNLVGKEGDNV